MKSLVLIFICSIILFSCEKQDLIEDPPVLSEIIYGDWELREEMSFLQYRNEIYNDITLRPYPVYKFFETDSFAVLLNNGTSEERIFFSGPFMINAEDSYISLSYAPYKVHGFSKDTLDYRYTGRHGPVGRKLFKID